MIYRQFQLPADFQPVTVRQALRQWYVPKKWQHFLRIEQHILVNQTYHSFNTLLYPNDQIQLYFTQTDAQHQTYAPSTGHHLDIFYEDPDLLVLNKPTQVKTHPNQPTDTDTLLNRVTHYLAPSHQKPYILHRLDRATSGLIMVAKNPAMVPILNAELREKEIKRYYLALVPKPNHLDNQGRIDLPIGRDLEAPPKRKIDRQGLKAITDYETLAENETYALLKISLQTGRTHQIRVHLTAKQAPILGDPLYYPESDCPRLMLHAYKMVIPLPFSSRKVTVKTPIPQSFLNRLH